MLYKILISWKNLTLMWAVIQLFKLLVNEKTFHQKKFYSIQLLEKNLILFKTKIKFTAENPIMVSDDIKIEKPDYNLTTTSWPSDAHIDIAIDYLFTRISNV